MPDIKVVKPVKAKHDELLPPDYDCRGFTHVMRDGVTFKDVLEPVYWTTLAEMLGVGTHFHPMIHVVNKEHTFYALLYARSVQENQVFVEVLIEPRTYGEVETDEGATMEIKFNQKSEKWYVRRKLDRQIIKGGLHTSEQAQEWLDDHMAKIAA